MKICFVHEEYPDETNFGGIATYQKIMAEELVKQGHDVYVICRSLQRDYQIVENGVHVYRSYVPNANTIKGYIAYRRKITKILLKLQNENKIDIIESPDWGAETIFFEPYRQIPLVIRLHTPLKIWLQYNQNNFGKITNKMLRWEKTLLQKADYLTCCSNALKRKIESNFSIPSSSINVTPNPANIISFYRDEKIEKKNILLFVGSLEERKGVCVLAQALNTVFTNYPFLKMVFIGKDTFRNKQNISTKEYIYRLVEKKYHNNLMFLGQVENGKINKYFNEAKVAVFPSLFDNFPYVVLEAMATGIHIVGSANSGMMEMLKDSSSIYQTGNASDLATKIIYKLNLSEKTPISISNQKRVQRMYHCKKICSQAVKTYQQVQRKYYQKNRKKDLQEVLSNITTSSKIIYQKREKMGVSNYVCRVYTFNKVYIIKKYYHDIDFSLSNQLYKLYQNEKISIIKPFTPHPIQYHGYEYNIFPYQKKSHKKRTVEFEFLQKLLCCDRRVTLPATILNKCDKYYFLYKKNN